MLDVIVSMYGSPRPHRTEWSTIVSRHGYNPLLVNPHEARSFLSDITEDPALFILECGHHQFEQGSNTREDALRYLHNVGKIAKRRDTPVLVVGDKTAFVRQAKSEIGRYALYFVDHPVTRGEMENAVKSCLAMKISEKSKPYLVVRDYFRIMNLAKEAVKKSMDRASLQFEKGKTYRVANGEYSVKYDNSDLFTSKGNDWLEFTPDSRSALAPLSLMLRNWRLDYESDRTDEKKTTIELCLK